MKQTFSSVSLLLRMHILYLIRRRARISKCVISQVKRSSQVTQRFKKKEKSSPINAGDTGLSLCLKALLEMEMATQSSILA